MPALACPEQLSLPLTLDAFARWARAPWLHGEPRVEDCSCEESPLDQADGDQLAAFLPPVVDLAHPDKPPRAGRATPARWRTVGLELEAHVPARRIHKAGETCTVTRTEHARDALIVELADAIRSIPRFATRFYSHDHPVAAFARAAQAESEHRRIANDEAAPASAPDALLILAGLRFARAVGLHPREVPTLLAHRLGRVPGSVSRQGTRGGPWTWAAMSDAAGFPGEADSDRWRKRLRTTVASIETTYRSSPARPAASAFAAGAQAA